MDGSGAGRKLWSALLAYTLGVVLVVTLAPFRFAWPDTVRVVATGGLFDLFANIALFVPLGFLYRLARPDPSGRGGLHVLALGLLTSAVIECTQLFQPARTPSWLDILTNGFGAWMGGRLHTRFAAGMDTGRWADRLSLELPLVGLLYLLIPLLWLSSLAVGELAFRLWLPLWLGLFGATVLGGVQRYDLGPSGLLTPTRTAAIATGGFLIGTAPAVGRWTGQLVAFAMVTATVTWWRGRSREGNSAERRFEIPVLRTAAPYFALYLLFQALAQLTGRSGPWHARLGFPTSASALSNGEILRLVESLAAFTILGFMIAEFRGRREVRFADESRPILLWAALAGLGFELLRGFRPGYGASVLQLTMLLAAALYGGWLYHLQRAHIRQRVATTHSMARRQT